MARTYLAHILIVRSAAASADASAQSMSEARAAADKLVAMPRLQGLPLAMLALAYLNAGRPARAQTTVDQAVAILADIPGHLDAGEALIRLAQARILDRTGQRARARTAIAAARDWVADRARSIGNPRWSRCFIRNVPENAEILALAESWLS
ncbi:MAG: hypothetical protein AAGC55_17030 [Myxococcota bacterium]